MGLITSKFQKKTTKERLELMEKDIHRLEATQNRNEELQKSIVLSFLVISVLLYVLAAAIFYLWYFPKKLLQRFLYLLPFIGFPVLIFFLKRLLHFIFVTRIAKNARSLANLKQEKKKILESVMETETYKVAKDILQRFDPNRKLVEQDTSFKEIQKSSTIGQEAKILTAKSSGVMLNTQTIPILKSKPPQVMPKEVHEPIHFRNGPQNFPTGLTPAKIAAPILPRDRSVFDKVAEYFVGDGPNNRYALICKQCFSHNGMALAEEFEFIAYKCCYCNTFNPARKQRSQAPKLPELNHGSDSSESDTSISTETSVNKELENCTQKKDGVLADEADGESTPAENQESKKDI